MFRNLFRPNCKILSCSFQEVSVFAKTSRSGQLVCYVVGLCVFFDDYANVLLAGKTLRPLLDALMVSREKLAFIVDATAAPIASISPVSSWVGFEVGLIQEQIDRIIFLEGTTDIGIEASGFGVFLQSIKYRYYPIFMIVLMAAMIFSRRDYGGMLIAERKVQVYRRTDGGDGGIGEHDADQATNPNKPRSDQPLHSWNMVFPVLILVCLLCPYESYGRITISYLLLPGILHLLSSRQDRTSRRGTSNVH